MAEGMWLMQDAHVAPAHQLHRAKTEDNNQHQ
jgi:hypothetical protein